MAEGRDDLDDLLDDAIQDFRKKDDDGKKGQRDQDWSKDFLEAEEDGTPSRSKSRGEEGGLHTPPNSFADASLFQKAMEERLKELNSVSFPKQGQPAATKGSPTKKAAAPPPTSSSSSSLPRPPPLPPAPTKEDLDRLMAEMGLGSAAQGGLPGAPGGAGSDPSDLMPMMEHMMSALLSKDLLYPAVRDMADKFPDWLAENRQKLAEEEFDRYNKQFDLCQQICLEFERELDDDEEEEDEKRRQFEKIMNLMTAMQMLGQPPKEICGEAPPMPMLPGGGGGGAAMPDQCKQS